MDPSNKSIALFIAAAVMIVISLFMRQYTRNTIFGGNTKCPSGMVMVCTASEPPQCSCQKNVLEQNLEVEL